MTHNEFKKIFSLILDNEATVDQRQAAEDHLKSCPSCRTYAAELKNLSSLLKTVADENPSPDLEHQFQKKFDTRRQTEGSLMKNKKYLKPAFAVAVLLLTLIGVQHIVNRGITGSLRDAVSIPGQFATIAGNFGQQGVSHVQEIRGKSIALVTGTPQGHYMAMALKDKSASGSTNANFVNGVTFGKTVRSATDSISSEQYAFNADYASGQYEPYYESQSSIQKGFVVEGAKIGTGESAWTGCSFPSLAGIEPGIPTATDEERYGPITEDKFLETAQNPLSTFSIDVDTASYSNLRRYLKDNKLPPQNAVRIEEMINYFSYDYPQPEGDKPFSITVESGMCPWEPAHQLVLVGLQGKSPDTKQLDESNLVFLIDVSGSMANPGKLDLLKKSFRLMVDQLTANERVAIVTYSQYANIALNSTSGDQKKKILDVIDHLRAEGSTAGAAGIQLAYDVAQKNFVKDGNNRVILATDGDFNVGVSSNDGLVRLIEEKKKKGIFLTVLGFGVGNYQDNKMQQLADKGNGNHYYIDNIAEGTKVMVNELGSTLFVIAKDVKIQIEFNPAQVKSYRLIGYENRMLAKEDFTDDTKDAGELGAGHTVTALYEIVPAWSKEKVETTSDLKYQTAVTSTSKDLLTVKLSYKAPDADKSQVIEQSYERKEAADAPASNNFRFASAVAEFGLLLRNTEHKTRASYDHVISAATAAKGKDLYGYRSEFIELVKKARSLDVRSSGPGIQFKGATKKK